MVFVNYTIDQQVAEISLNRPPVNALVTSMIDDLLVALQRARIDPLVRAVIIRSAGPGPFSAGLDLKELDGKTAEQNHELIEKLYVQMSEAQARLGKPSIAVVEGAARGGGMTLAILCDLIVASTNASFGYPEINVGVLPAIHFSHLPRIVGRHRAFDLLFTGRTFGVDEAHSLGLVSRITSPDEALSQARALAQTLVAKPPGAMKRGRAAFYREFESNLHGAAAVALETFSSVAATREARDAIHAFATAAKPSEPK